MGLIAAGAVWAANPFAAARQSVIGAAAVPPAADTGGGRSRVAEASLQQTSQPASTPGTTTHAGAAVTLRQWETSVPGRIIDPLLSSRLDQALVGVEGHVSVAVEDLGSGRTAMLDGDREMPSASLYKLPVLYTVFAEGLALSEELPITEDARSYDAGTMELGVGESLTVAEALERMVTLSDNTTAVMLGSRVGANQVNASIAALGMETTHYSLERMTTSALDMLRFVERLATGKAVSRSASADMLHLMLRQRVNDRLPRLLPSDVQVAHKTGNLPGTVNDVGIIYGSSSTVAIAVLVSDTADKSEAAMGIARVAQAAYTYFESQPEDASRPLIPPAPERPIPPVWREPHPVPLPPPLPLLVAAPTRLPTETQPAGGASLAGAPAASATSVPGTAPAPATDGSLATPAPNLQPTPPLRPTATPGAAPPPPPPTPTVVPAAPTPNGVAHPPPAATVAAPAAPAAPAATSVPVRPTPVLVPTHGLTATATAIPPAKR